MIYKLFALSCLSTFLISVGLYMVFSKKKAIEVVVGLEIIANGVALNLILMSLGDPTYTGGIVALFLIIFSTINLAFILTIFILLFKSNRSANLPNIDNQNAE